MNTKSPNPLPLGDALGGVMVQLKAVAAASGDSLLLADGPPQPDWRLLDLCGDALHYSKAANAAYGARDRGPDVKWTDAHRRRDAALMAEYNLNTNECAKLLRLAKKIKATTPAGIYAKALLVRCSKTGATELAMSLANDLVDCKALRATLYADVQEYAT